MWRHIRNGNDQLASALSFPRATAALITAFAAALLLTAIGLYALAAYSVARRTRELGIRIASAPHPLNILKTVLRRTAVLTLGLLLANWTSNLLTEAIYGITPTEPPSYIAAAIPARRATTTGPANTLRQE